MSGFWVGLAGLVGLAFWVGLDVAVGCTVGVGLTVGLLVGEDEAVGLVVVRVGELVLGAVERVGAADRVGCGALVRLDLPAGCDAWPVAPGSLT